MDRIQKFLLKLDKNRRSICLKIFQDIRALNLKKYDIETLKSVGGVFRLRKGNIRIIFAKQNNKGFVINADFRQNIYKKI
ncbi:MAG: type II toxin-antitoxin system RelE/ParE family toxin [Patescibacteria group bacterium]